MKKLVVIWLFIGLILFSNKITNAGNSTKSNELSILFGASYYTGELNYEGHFKQMSPAVGLALRQNLDTRWAIRYNFLYLKAKGSDKQAQGRYGFGINSGQSFSSKIYELSAVGEFNFFPFSTGDKKSFGATPFLFAGLGGFYFNPSGSSVGLDANGHSNIAMSLPFGFGFKVKASQRFIFTFEYGLRKTYTDHIDDVNSIYPNTQLQFGHELTNDSYSFTALSISIRLGRQFNDCAFGNGF